jgi:uncharacterized short protein YbdD (DUF466 family)
MTSRLAAVLQRLSRRLARTGEVLRAVAGVPDYERYLSHMRAHHPGTAPLTRDDFARTRMAERYEKPGSKCC